VLKGVEPHPVISLSIRDAETIVTTAQVQKGSDLVGKTLGKMRLATMSGMWIVAIKRDRRYIYGPDEDTQVLEGDVMFARGPVESEEYLRDLASGKERLG
jgi:uncharacterized protein with PhoU and TrkA domain